MLIDRQIRAALQTGDLVVVPSEGIDMRVQPASLDLRLGDTFGIFRRNGTSVIDTKSDTSHLVEKVTVAEGEPFVIHPGEFMLAATLEEIGLCQRLVARIEGRSSLGRLGLLVHSTAGFIDPGWPLASITLELANVNMLPINLYAGMPIAQLAFDAVEEAGAPYSGKYVDQFAPTPSRFHENWTGSRWI